VEHTIYMGVRAASSSEAGRTIFTALVLVAIWIAVHTVRKSDTGSGQITFRHIAIAAVSVPFLLSGCGSSSKLGATAPASVAPEESAPTSRTPTSAAPTTTIALTTTAPPTTAPPTTTTPERSAATPGHFSFTSTRGYQYEIGLAIRTLTFKTVLADPGKSAPAATMDWTVTIQNKLADRAAPFEAVETPTPLLLYKIQPDLAQYIKSIPWRVGQPIYQIGDDRYYGFVPPVCACADLANLKSLPAGGTSTLRGRTLSTATQPSYYDVVFEAGGGTGWSEDKARELIQTMQQGPAFVELGVSTGSEGFCSVFVAGATSWVSAQSLGWPSCVPAKMA
jgi:hypothetical protein